MIIGVYNSAGEVVRHLMVTGAYGIPGNFTINNSTFSPDDGGRAQIIVDQTTTYWDGTTDQNTIVQNGIYYVKIEVLDKYGISHTLVQPVTVLTNSISATFKIFNSAGEVVKNIPVTLASTGSNVLTAASPVFAPGTGSGGALNTEDFTYLGQVIKWDGTNDENQIVANGVYTASIVTTDKNAFTAVASTQITVLHDAYEIIGDLRIIPNPVNNANNTVLHIKYDAIAGAKVTGKIYNMAGELVNTLHDSSGAGELVWDLSADRKIAGGLYVAVINCQTDSGMRKTIIGKFVILR
jgi:flagellar hook assembly protein FlgD